MRLANPFSWVARSFLEKLEDMRLDLHSDLRLMRLMNHGDVPGWLRRFEAKLHRPGLEGDRQQSHIENITNRYVRWANHLTDPQEIHDYKVKLLKGYAGGCVSMDELNDCIRNGLDGLDFHRDDDAEVARMLGNVRRQQITTPGEVVASHDPDEPAVS